MAESLAFTSDGMTVRSHYQWRSLTSNRSPRGLIYRPQTKAWTVRSRCQTRRWCSSKPDPPDTLQSSRRRPAITRLEARSRPTSHHIDPSDPPGQGNIGDWSCSRAGWGQIVLAANRNGGMLRLIASRHDDDDDDMWDSKSKNEIIVWFMKKKDWKDTVFDRTEQSLTYHTKIWELTLAGKKLNKSLLQYLENVQLPSGSVVNWTSPLYGATPNSLA